MKTCRRCNQAKATRSFWPKKRVCKACWAAYKKKRYHSEPVVKEQHAARLATVEGRARALALAAKTRSRTYGLDFSLSEQVIADALRNGVCPKTGFPFDLTPSKVTRYHPFAPSLDRIDKTRGYTPDNVQVVCNWYNIAKNEYSENQLLAFCRAAVAAADREKNNA